jgi:cold shock CspA family protein
LFVHVAAVEKAGLDELREGDKVTFAPALGPFLL